MSDSAVYVNYAFIPYRRMKLCHLWSRDLQALNEMADRLGMRQEWIVEENPYFIHYVISKGKRQQAISLGAKEITTRQMAEKRRSFKAQKTK